MKQLLVFLLLLCSASVSAQDVIVKKDGSTIVCQVVEVSATEITYKKWSEQNGSNYVMDKSLASAINYENGKKENLSEVTNLYTPGNQNDGTQQYNDNALLAMDAADHARKKIKRHFKWNIKAGYSLDKMTGDGNSSFSSGTDISLGVVYPLKNSNYVIGGDLFFATYSFNYKKGSLYSDVSLKTSGIGIAPYVGYKYTLSNNVALVPYIGPWIATTGGCKNDFYWFNGYGEDLEKRVYWKISDGVKTGLNIGLNFFVSKSFYFDIHCKKGIMREGERHQYHHEIEGLHSLKLVAGIGIIF